MLEGREGLIQDPHKLHDEVRGRRELFDPVLDGGPMRCAGERCGHCFIRELCRALIGAVATVEVGAPGVLGVDLTGGTLSASQRSLLRRPRRAVWVIAQDAVQVAATPLLDGAKGLWLELADLRWLSRTLRAASIPSPARLVVSSPATLRHALRLAPPELAVSVERRTAGVLGRITAPAGTRLVLYHRPSLTLRETAEQFVDPTSPVRDAAADDFEDIPPCLSGSDRVSYSDPLPLSVVGEGGRIDLDAFVAHFIRDRYRVKSMRCRRCRHDARCRGIGIQVARHAGLRILSPMDAGR